MQPLQIAVLYGGKSTEHEVSVHCAQTVCRVLASQPDKYKIYPIFIDRSGHWFLQQECSEGTPADKPVTPVFMDGANIMALDGSARWKADVFFPVLHGTNGEDGTIEGLFELLDTPYVGCGVLASALGMDKELAKLIAHQSGAPVLPYVIVEKGVDYNKAELEEWAQEVGYPVFVKPVSLGSSVGVTKVKSADGLHKAVDFALRYDNRVMVEKGVDNAREIFCALLGEGEDLSVSACGELKTLAGEFFDYNAKYLVQGGCETRVPADLPEDLQVVLRSDAAAVFNALRGSGLARVDFLLDKDNHYYFSEINTLPGMSETSLYPQLFEASGIPYASALDKLVELALNRHTAQKQLAFNRD